MNLKSMKKKANLATLYIVSVAIIFTILIPVYFIFSISFLSTREAYQYPLPLFPELRSEIKLENGDRGVLLSIYDKRNDEYETLLDTTDFKKMSTYMRTNLSLNFTKEELEEKSKLLLTQSQVVFKARKDVMHNYKTFFQVTRDAVPALIRSIQIAIITILISLSIGGTAGYTLARYRFKGKHTLKFSILFVRMFPGVAIAMPMVIILANMGLYDQPLGLSLVYAIGSIALTTWITTSIFLGIPVELEEAAQVFGASKFRTFMNITLPLALPGLAASSMYAFLGAWNETISALILTQFKPTFAVVVYQALYGSTGQVNLTAAGGICMAIPTLIFTFIIRKYITQMWGDVSV